MQRFTRRDACLAVGAVGSLALAGCLAAPGGDPGTGDSDDDDDDDDDDDGDIPDDVEYDVFQLGPSLSRPHWAEHDDRPGFVALAESPRDLWMIDDPDEVDGLEEWVTATDFEASVIVYVGTVAPNACYTDLEVTEVAVSSERVGDEDEDEVEAITGTARAIDTSDDDAACAQAVTYPSALVRVTDEDLPSVAAFTVTDGWGEPADLDTTGGVIDPDALSGYVRPSRDPQTIPDDLECPDEAFERHWSPDDEVAWGEVHAEGEPTLAMRVHNPQYDGDDETRALEFERGDEVQVSMQNVADRPVDTGNRYKYALEVLTDEGWQDVRGTTDDVPPGYTDEAVVHRPGEGFEWSIELTEDGVLDGHVHESRLEVCPDLPAGRYRFSFWGAIGEEALAVAFDYVS
ncbi:hypothetical protein [Natrialbaceae archaeon AArc-T1-2]|uniref:hypothetical protein n=1 Tax=Natrialbaceae archaeon AArc-T1-2 TaxID=3053904 RepID=UPI00255ADCC2|nr:hypothetical protein [Natrialbaceae archaeon AArc-T1-2]WIV66622.1 hypothetical protein QQ977_13110 [Natrialbaceae archaeon AArc-T1-2]